MEIIQHKQLYEFKNEVAERTSARKLRRTPAKATPLEMFKLVSSGTPDETPENFWKNFWRNPSRRISNEI